METLNIFFEQTLVGTLRFDDKRSFWFQYSENWLNSPQSFPLSVSLPLQEPVFYDDKAKPFFANLLPESSVRELIAKRLGISDKNDFVFLERLGGECAGALSILPDAVFPLSRENYLYRLLSDEQLSDLIKKIPTRPLLAGEDGVRISLAGAQEKLALFCDDSSFYIPLNNAPSNCILKSAMAHFDFSIENECFCMMLASDMGLKTPFVDILEKKGQKALLIMRYDRIHNNGNVRLHQEDFCQAMGISHELKYQADGGPGLKDCFNLVRNYSANPIKDMQQLIRWVFFNYMIGNMDAHAKNLSFLYNLKQIRLAPFYDILCTNIYEDLSKKFAMKIGGENRPEWVMARHWERFAGEIKISPIFLKKRLSDFCREITGKIDKTYERFIKKYGKNEFAERITVAVKKRTLYTLERC